MLPGLRDRLGGLFPRVFSLASSGIIIMIFGFNPKLKNEAPLMLALTWQSAFVLI